MQFFFNTNELYLLEGVMTTLHKPLKQLSHYKSPTSSRRPIVSVGDKKWLYVLLGSLLTPEASRPACRQRRGMPQCLWGRVAMVCNHGCSVTVKIGPGHFSSLLFIHLLPLPLLVNGKVDKHYKLPPKICFSLIFMITPSIHFFVCFTCEAKSCIVQNKALCLLSWLPFWGTYPVDLEIKYHTHSLKTGYVKMDDVICGRANQKSPNALMRTTPFSWLFLAPGHLALKPRMWVDGSYFIVTGKNIYATTPSKFTSQSVLCMIKGGQAHKVSVETGDVTENQIHAYILKQMFHISWSKLFRAHTLRKYR